ncbi:J domain-containing protein [Natrinema salaciae]|uniref:DnaJ domain-containing protein n=1 Tax=Natrinema salaciae TaxID=1186196 RepID=A0A1H9EJ89_9EURY|nr:J domain-containing protein [Natrinema salaciae]SEQ25685.1 DnaJ domain-containing protein [Natrinema salaciae]
MGETYYDVLEVDPDATADEIESAYRERVLETHPDHSDDPDAAEQFQRVTTAKSVLTDGTERARYDRLGHETYVGLAQGAATGDDSSDDGDGDGFDRSVSDTRTKSETADGTGTSDSDGADRTGTDGRRTSGRTAGWTRTETTDTESTRSHHARQRSRRRRQRAKRRAAGDWPFDNDDTATPGGTTGAATETTTKSGAATKTDADEEFRYSVHDWDGEVDLEWRGPRIDRHTAISVGTVALLYPLFVAASLTPLFSLPINAVVVACTLVLVGYLLTMPRIATVAFGGWSVLFPIGLVAVSSIDPLSLYGLLLLGFAWVPFGYAVALWWALRP